MSTTKPTLYLSNWSGHRTPGMHGPGRKFTIMAKPRAWEHGDGTALALVPSGREAEMMTRAVALRGTPEGVVEMIGYRAAIESRWEEQGRLRAPLLMARDGYGDHTSVRDGDTLCCACSVAEARAGRCHRTWAAPFLHAAGWRVVLDGREWGTDPAGLTANDIEVIRG